MAINLQRADRQTEFWKDHYGEKVGPGMYGKFEQTQFQHKRDA
jgi:hypothetical protein